MKESIIIAILVVLGLSLLSAWGMWSIRKQANKDWDRVKYFEDAIQNVSAKEEIENVHKEFIEWAKTVNNKLITPKLHYIDGYLRGLHKQFK